jgi:hypothetical protein
VDHLLSVVLSVNASFQRDQQSVFNVIIVNVFNVNVVNVNVVVGLITISHRNTAR